MNGINSYNEYNTNQQGYPQNNAAGYQQNTSAYSNNGYSTSQSNSGYNIGTMEYSQSNVGVAANQVGYSQNNAGAVGNQVGYSQNYTGSNNIQTGYSQNNMGNLGYNGNVSGCNSGLMNNNYSAPVGYNQGTFSNFYNSQNRLARTQNGKKVRISFNSPVILWFAIICLVVLIIQYISGDSATYVAFSVYRSSLLDPMTYIRFFGHALGHADLEHYMGNMMYLLIVGPLLEEKYGSKSIILVMVVTALVTGVFNFIFCPDVATLGASGIVFAFILLSSLTCMKEGEIPLTFIVVAILYLGEQVLEAAFVESNISNVSHIVGGLCGCVLGYLLNKNKLKSIVGEIGTAKSSNTDSSNNSNNNYTY